MESQEICVKNGTKVYKNYGVLSFNSIVYELAEIAEGIETVATQCRKELLEFRAAAKDEITWAFKS